MKEYCPDDVVITEDVTPSEGDNSSILTPEGPSPLKEQLSPPTAPNTFPDMVNLWSENHENITSKQHEIACTLTSEMHSNKPSQSEVNIGIRIAATLINHNGNLQVVEIILRFPFIKSKNA